MARVKLTTFTVSLTPPLELHCYAMWWYLSHLTRLLRDSKMTHILLACIGATNKQSTNHKRSRRFKFSSLCWSSRCFSNLISTCSLASCTLGTMQHTKLCHGVINAASQLHHSSHYSLLQFATMHFHIPAYTGKLSFKSCMQKKTLKRFIQQ